MATPSSGAISLNEMHVEVGGSSGSTVSIDDSDIRALTGKSSGATASWNDYYDKAKDWSISMTVGATNVFSAAGDYNAESNIRYKGYNTTFRPSGTNYGSMNDYADSDFLGGQTIETFNVSGNSTVTSAQDTTMLFATDSSSALVANNDTAFKKVTINSNVYNRSDATYVANSGDRSQWQWAINQTVPDNNTSAMTPFTAPGNSCSIVFSRNP
ncbi:MAG: hypothetical protein CBC64_005630 [Gammaproteobacteria bacterium TMED104]|nr:MAG: hypothetical protein CBC64_005630 [Gammaproteobacteria bacterium TMED104]|tara:strand:+ start:908 stop:1546 length:639 start_codon:yes stop_codon:yes gene_type:complete